MSVTYYSEAVIFTIEPEKIRDLIAQVYNLEPNQHGYCFQKPDVDYTAFTLCNLKVGANTITFNSGSYGVFGLDEIRHPDEDLLFKYLFDNFDGSLVCHEVVKSCQDSDEPYYSSTWAKPEGEVPDDEYICVSAVGRVSNDDPDFQTWWVWNTYSDDRLITPSIKQLIKTVKAKGFTDWATEEELGEFYSENKSDFVTINTMWAICDKYKDLEDLAQDAINEAEGVMWEYLKPTSFDSIEVDLPEELETLVNQYNKEHLTDIGL